MNIATWICIGVIGSLMLLGFIGIWRSFNATGSDTNNARCRCRRT